MATMRAIKTRRESIKSTQQITNAMKLVATVKLQKSKSRAENTKPYFEHMYRTISSILARTVNTDHPYIVGNDSRTKAIIAVSSNRGLAGGYNSNIVKLVMGSSIDTENDIIYAVGGKGRDAFIRKGVKHVIDYSDCIENPVYQDAKVLCDELLKAYNDGAIGEIYLVYTSFVNTVVHEPALMRLLPVDMDALNEDVELDNIPMNYEPDETQALGFLIPNYITSMIYGAFNEAVASENGARMQAMDSATNNAEEMIGKLTVQYNRARQGAITQELTEIIAGAGAIE
ncbi:MAG: ATP synthase F1 subunit gamma [Lachnospiraceae bacterium]|nr:ATP synthase F1 subunit gamma [Lachnospiraceae bacterium]